MAHNKLRARLEKGDEPFVRIAGQDFTYNEIHAVALGCFGFALGERGLSVATIAREPHYFVGAFAISYLIGRHYDESRYEK